MRRLIPAGLIALACLMAACGQTAAPKFQLTDVTGADFGKSLALTDHTGKPRTLADLKEDVVIPAPLRVVGLIASGTNSFDASFMLVPLHNAQEL